MKRFWLLLIVLLTCFNLAGGYAIAAAAFAQTSETAEQDLALPNHAHQHHLKKASYEVQLLQVNKSESEEDELVHPPFLLLSTAGNFRPFLPDFKLLNKFFLVHYAAAIKDRLPVTYILHQNFRL